MALGKASVDPAARSNATQTDMRQHRTATRPPALFVAESVYTSSPGHRRGANPEGSSIRATLEMATVEEKRQSKSMSYGEVEETVPAMLFDSAKPDPLTTRHHQDLK